MIEIRREKPEDVPAIRSVNETAFGITSQWKGVPDEAFMILVLDASAMKGVSGVAQYRNEFDEAM